MKINFKQQVGLLLKVLPIVANSKVFALKGGTAINLFLRNMPRLSVDIDLTYLPIKDRKQSLDEIQNELIIIANEVKRLYPRFSIDILSTKEKIISKLVVSNQLTQIKIEPNFILRGTVYPCERKTLCEKAQNDFETFIEINLVSKADLFGGKLCAGLDRQHLCLLL
jgi:predicted nucleotidyltransferase component of viral defense system